MDPAVTGHEGITHDDLLVHNWRVPQLTRLGVPGPLAEVYAVQRGCPARLAIRVAL